MHLYELLACFALISSIGVCVFASFPVGLWYLSRFLDLDWPLFVWGYGLACLAYIVISAMPSSPYSLSCEEEKNLDCIMRFSNILGV